MVGVWLSVRLLIIQYLNILIIIIIISFLSLCLEASDRHACQPTVLALAGARNWSWSTVDVVVGAGGLTCCEIASWAERGRLMVHQALLIGDIDRIHLHRWIVVHRCQVLQMHVVGGANEELLLLLSTSNVTAVSCSVVILLLLQLHVAILVLAVGQRVIQALSVVPCLLRTLLTARALGPWSLWQLEMVVSACLVGGDGLHVQAAAVHRSVLRSWALLVLGYFDIQCAGFVFVK